MDNKIPDTGYFRSVYWETTLSWGKPMKHSSFFGIAIQIALEIRIGVFHLYYQVTLYKPNDTDAKVNLDRRLPIILDIPSRKPNGRKI